MEAQGSNAVVSLLSLPDALLTAILLHLDVRTRAACQLVCRRLAAVGDASPQLWEALSLSHNMSYGSPQDNAGSGVIDMRTLDHLLPFLARGTRPVKHLRLFVPRASNVPATAAARGEHRIAPPAFFQGTCLLRDSLRSLSLSLCGQTVEVGQWVQPLRHLTRLSITAGEARLTCSLGTLPALEKLEIEGAALAMGSTCLPHSLSTLQFFKLSRAPTGMGALTRLSGLRQLKLIACWLRSLPAELSALQSLQQLDASENDLTTAGSLSALAVLSSSLTGLSLAYCSLASLPSQLAALSRLQQLGVEKNFNLHGEDVFSVLARLSALTRLDIGDCDLEKLPAEVSALRGLQMLVAPCSSFMHPDSLAALHGLPALRYLDLRRCGLRQLPAVLFQLPALEALDLRHNFGMQLWSTAGSGSSGGGSSQPGNQALPALRMLTFSSTQAAQVVVMLPSVSQLRHLCLQGLPTLAGAVAGDASGAAALWRALQCTPGLRVLQCEHAVLMKLTQQQRDLQALISFIRARPEVELFGEEVGFAPVWESKTTGSPVE